MNIEDKWRADFELYIIEDNEKYPFNHPLELIRDDERYLDPEAQSKYLAYLSARRKAQKEIDSKLDEKELTMLNILMRNEISAEMKRLENHSARPKNYLQELEILKGKLK